MSTAAQQRSFTGDKLDWMTALCADSRLGLPDFKVGFCIAQHVNVTTGCAILSDDTISDKTNINRRSVVRSRANLKAHGWIGWKRTMTANIYWTIGDNINAVTDHQILLRDARQERKKKLIAGRRVVSKVAYLNEVDRPPEAQSVVSKVALTRVSKVANILPSSFTPSANTPSKIDRLSEEGISENEREAECDPTNPLG
jgi:hypothetical protein